MARQVPLASLRIIDLARAMAIEPDVLMLDEMTAALPANLTERVLDVIGRQRGGERSVIFISHRMIEIAAVCDRATVLRRSGLRRPDGRWLSRVDVTDLGGPTPVLGVLRPDLVDLLAGAVGPEDLRLGSPLTDLTAVGADLVVGALRRHDDRRPAIVRVRLAADVPALREAVDECRHRRLGELERGSEVALAHDLASALRLVPAGTTVDAASSTAALKAAKAVPLFLGNGATYSCDGTAHTGLRALCSAQGHIVEYSGKGTWVDKGVF